MTAVTVKVTNKLATPLSLYNAEGDSIQLPVGNMAHNVPRTYIDFQAPSLSVAEIEGYDYAKNCFLGETKEVTATVEAPEEVLEPVVVVDEQSNTPIAPLSNAGNRQPQQNGNNRPNNPQR